jgi:hypothetical protein
MLLQTTNIPQVDSWAIGPAARVFEGIPDAVGRLSFQLEGQTPKQVPLGDSLGSIPLGVVAMPGALALFRLDEPERLAGMSFYIREDTVSVIYDDDGPTPWLVDARGERRRANNVCREVYLLGGRAILDERTQAIGFGFLMNANNRERFSEDALRRVRDDAKLINRLELAFEAKNGLFRYARWTLQEKESQKLLEESHFDGFPIVFPSRPKRRVRPIPGHLANGFVMGASGTWKAAPAPPPPKPLAPTINLHLGELTTAIQAENDPARQWAMIEENLRLLRPERTFRLISFFPSLIHERTEEWPAERVKETFGEQPVAALLPLVPGYRNEVVLSLMDDHPGREELLEAWRESELDRLLKLPVDSKLETKEEARAYLHLGPAADKGAAKKVWRLLLGFLNADFGRKNEMGIHQKKDELAKRLTMARDLLAKG